MSLSPLLHLSFLSLGTFAAASVAAVWPGLSAARRHLVWQAAFALVAICTPLALIHIRIPIAVPQIWHPSSSPQTAAAISLRAESSNPTIQDSPSENAIASPRQRPDWVLLAWSAWALGAFVAALRPLAGFILLCRVRRQARFIGRCREDGTLSVESDRGIAVLSSTKIGTPMAVGIRSPAILIPEKLCADAGDRLHAAFLHELAHAKFSDPGFRLLAGFVTSLHWFNPLSWVAARQLRIAAELAADDEAARRCRSHSEYAEALLSIIRFLKPADPRLFPASPMAEFSEIGARISRLLDAEINHSPISASVRRFLIFGAVSLGVSVSILRPVSAENGPSPDPSAPSSPATQAATATPALPPNQVEIEFNLLEVDGEVFKKNRQLFEDAMASTSEVSFQNFLRKLNSLPGKDLFSAPKVTTKSDRRATIQIVREFAYPTNFDSSGTPQQFETKNIGIEFEVTPRVSGDKTIINGTLRATDFLGYVDGENRSPAFQTREARIFRELKTDEAAVMQVPWQEGEKSLLAKLDKPADQPDSTAPGKHLLFILRARHPEPLKQLPKEEGEKYLHDLLQKTQLRDRKEVDVPVTDLVGRLLGELMETNNNEVLITWHSSIPGEVQKVTLDTKGMNAKQALDEIRKQTGLAYHIEGSTLSIAPDQDLVASKQVAPDNTPYATAVPNKPGFVISPYATDAGYVDVRGFPPGASVPCPYTKKMFRVP